MPIKYYLDATGMASLDPTKALQHSKLGTPSLLKYKIYIRTNEICIHIKQCIVPPVTSEGELSKKNTLKHKWLIQTSEYIVQPTWVVGINTPYQNIPKTPSQRFFQEEHIKNLHQYQTRNHTLKNITIVTPKDSCNFSTAKINPMSMKPNTESQENLHMTPKFTTAVTNTTTNKPKNYKQLMQ